MYRKNISTLSNLCNVTRQFSELYSPVVLYRFIFLCKTNNIMHTLQDEYIMALYVFFYFCYSICCTRV